MRRFLIANISVITILAVVYLFAREASHVYALYQENEKIKSNIEELESKNEGLRKKIELLQEDNSYIEKMARDELGMIKQSEKIYRFEE
jgi:cell division protein FtsB